MPRPTRPPENILRRSTLLPFLVRSGWGDLRGPGILVCLQAKVAPRTGLVFTDRKGWEDHRRTAVLRSTLVLGVEKHWSWRRIRRPSKTVWKHFTRSRNNLVGRGNKAATMGQLIENRSPWIPHAQSFSCWALHPSGKRRKDEGACEYAFKEGLYGHQYPRSF